MKVLIVEDDESKVRYLQEVLGEVVGIVVVGVCFSYKSALNALATENIDLVILDMTLPLYDETSLGGGGRKMQFGGELILKEMAAEGMNQKVIVVSQHDFFAEHFADINLKQLGERLRLTFGACVVDTILYDSSQFVDGNDQGWRKQLKQSIALCLTN